MAAAKGELLHRISDGGLAVVNADDPRVASLSERIRPPDQLRHDRGEVRAEIESLGLEDSASCSYPAASKHSPESLRSHKYTATPAATAALLEKVELPVIAAGLEAFTPYKGRFQIEQLGGITLIDDSYNANPPQQAALPSRGSGGHRIAVLLCWNLESTRPRRWAALARRTPTTYLPANGCETRCRGSTAGRYAANPSSCTSHGDRRRCTKPYMDQRGHADDHGKSCNGTEKPDAASQGNSPCSTIFILATNIKLFNIFKYLTWTITL